MVKIASGKRLDDGAFLRRSCRAFLLGQTFYGSKKRNESMASNSNDLLTAILTLVFLFSLVALMISANWIVFKKAGQPGWASLVPIYNLLIMLKVIGRPGWWLILLLIPLVSLIVSLIIPFDLAKSFGKGIGFGFGLLFLPFIFYPILAFGESEYQGSASLG